jgi:hypothetical protein
VASPRTATLRATAPMLRAALITRTPGNRAAACAEPSADALSTTTTRGCSGSAVIRSKVRVSSGRRSLVMMTTVNR